MVLARGDTLLCRVVILVATCDSSLESRGTSFPCLVVGDTPPSRCCCMADAIPAVEMTCRLPSVSGSTTSSREAVPSVVWCWRRGPLDVASSGVSSGEGDLVSFAGEEDVEFRLRRLARASDPTRVGLSSRDFGDAASMDFGEPESLEEFAAGLTGVDPMAGRGSLDRSKCRIIIGGERSFDILKNFGDLRN